MQTPADDFETRLEAMFADPPEAPDAETFALTVERRLASEDRRRRMVLGACTAAAGLAAAGIFAVFGAARGISEAISASSAAELNWIPLITPLAAVAVVLLVVSELAPTVRRR